ncbi:hypothetical protein [Sorangium sp. So ce1099]|uniref:hypothetical protein n=1 Tax=Sorangium sp. So ce1099 TaxID=3133331 RepID=UPI003F5E185F
MPKPFDSENAAKLEQILSAATARDRFALVTILRLARDEYDHVAYTLWPPDIAKRLNEANIHLDGQAAEAAEVQQRLEGLERLGAFERTSEAAPFSYFRPRGELIHYLRDTSVAAAWGIDSPPDKKSDIDAAIKERPKK